ncbi:MAG: polysaccharide deacetylase family protein [Methanococcaceae archaeon]
MRYRKVKLLISLFYWNILQIKKLILHCLGKKEPGKCVAVYYHSIHDSQKEKFAQQMEYLLKITKPLQAGAKLKLDDEKNYVIITFDDGYQSMFKNALPAIVRLNIPCAIFFPTNFIGKAPKWEEWNIYLEYNEILMTPEQIKSLPEELITIGSHSHSHPVLSKISPKEAQEEFYKSRNILESILGRKVTLFSFPYGEFNEKVTKLAFAAGYKRLFTIQPEVNFSKIENDIVGRFNVDPSDSFLEFKLKLLGAYKWMEIVYPVKQMLRSRFELFPVKDEILPEPGNIKNQ